MTKHILKSIEKIVEDTSSRKITIFTEHLKIDGEIFLPEGKCEECHDKFITLENALSCRLSDYCKCDGNSCDCDDYICFKYDWLNISIDKIVSFSIIQ